MGDKKITSCPKCGKVLCKIGFNSNVEVVCKNCKSKYDVINQNGNLVITPVRDDKTKLSKKLSLAD